MRNAYALAQVGTIEGGLYIGKDGAQTFTKIADGQDYVFQADGSLTLTSTTGGNYTLKATVATGDKATKCKESAVCNLGSNAHTQGLSIHVKSTPDSDATGYTVELAS